LTTCSKLQFRCGEIWAHSGEKRSKPRTGHPSNPFVRSELIIVHSWYIWKGQFDIGYACLVQMMVENLLETSVQMWGDLATHSGEKRPKLRTGHPFNPSFRSELIKVHSWYI